jgi:hypothetical protein
MVLQNITYHWGKLGKGTWRPLSLYYLLYLPVTLQLSRFKKEEKKTQ